MVWLQVQHNAPAMISSLLPSFRATMMTGRMKPYTTAQPSRMSPMTYCY
jgi:hypothetical protein